MTIRAVIFDIGGVLETLTETGFSDVLQKWESHLHLEPGEMAKRFNRLDLGSADVGKISEEEMVALFGTGLGIKEEWLDDFMHDFWQAYMGKLNTELATYFGNLRPRYRTAILSNAFPGARRREQERYNFDEMADVIIYSNEVGINKPDRRIFEITCERLSAKPEEIIFLDNAEQHVRAARAFGIHAVLFRETAQAIADVQAYLEI